MYRNETSSTSGFRALTFEEHFGDSWISYLDWVNPFEAMAAGAEAIRAVQREIDSEMIGIIVTVKQEGAPSESYTFDVDGKLLSVGFWKKDALDLVLTADAFFRLAEISATDPPSRASLFRSSVPPRGGIGGARGPVPVP